MSKFLYPVAFKTTSEEQKKRLVDTLASWGYNPSKVGYITDNIYLHTRNATTGHDVNLIDSSSQCGRFLCQSEDEFLALSSMREGSEFHVGEYAVTNITWTVYQTKYDNNVGHLHKYIGRKMFDMLDGNTQGNTLFSGIRKATKEEIINHFRKNTGFKVDSVGSVDLNRNSEPQFKVGDEVEMTHRGLRQIGKIIEIKQCSYPYQVLSEGVRYAVLEKEIRKVASNTKEPFTVEGNKYLKRALLREIGFNRPDVRWTEPTEYLTFYAKKSKTADVTINKLQRHFVLESQYGETVSAIIDFYKEDKPAEVKVTLGNGVEVIVEAKQVGRNGYRTSIDGVREIAQRLSPMEGGSLFHYVYSLDISPLCKDGIKGITYADTQLILDTHAKCFGE